MNYAKSETDGYDLAANYAFELGEHMFSIRVSGTKVNDNTRYQNPLDLSEKDPELLEIGAPEYAGNIFLKYQIGSLSLGWQSQFISEMLLGNGPEVETYETLFVLQSLWTICGFMTLMAATPYRTTESFVRCSQCDRRRAVHYGQRLPC